MKVKALTLTQPWATLVLIGAKRIETRSGDTTHRGDLYIHAASGLAGMTKADFTDLCRAEPCCSVLAAAGYTHPAMLPRGSALGSVTLIRCERFTPENTAPLSDQERAFGNFESGRYGWFLTPTPLLCRSCSAALSSCGPESQPSRWPIVRRSTMNQIRCHPPADGNLEAQLEALAQVLVQIARRIATTRPQDVQSAP